MNLNCPHCGNANIEVCVDAYVVYKFIGFNANFPGNLHDDTFIVNALRTDEFEDYKVVCGACGQEVTADDFEQAATPSRGNCYECGKLALFCSPDRYGPDHQFGKAHLLCGIHAANVAAFEQERLVPLFFDDTDYGGTEPPEEWVRVQEAYPLIINDKEDN